ncbi:aldehyde ferredoxin oxidoreductase C-terminal domain-containing protein [Microtetraspora malaysiensis]|uniref:aldehyde ferredoxin oxidoreductase C-terminal domain-containing protein n=1 Tax=Microtetraspora malaysiensis TaxID=161358 RepID=UPI003D8E891F
MALFSVDLGSGTVHRSEESGGSILGLRLLLERTPGGLEPYAPEALLYVAAGPLGGTAAPGLAKAVFLAKSPLMGIAGESHALGPFASGLHRTSLAITGRAEVLSYLLVRDGRISLHRAPDLRGLGVAAVTDMLRQRYGDAAHVAAIGPAGESLVRYASVVTDYAFPAMRYGLGAVFGAKNLKAIVCVGSPPPVSDPAGVETIARFYREAIPHNPLTVVQHDPPGYGAWAGARLDPGYAAVRNFSYTGDSTLRLPTAASYLGREVALTGNCPGCPTDCLKIYGPGRTGGLGQEAFLSLGWNLGIDDLDAVLEANALCNDLGLDQVSLGGTLAFAMEAALPPTFGDPLPDLIHAIAHRSGKAGDLLAEGSARAARTLGVSCAMTVKSAEIPPFDPRIQPGIGLGYALSPSGPRYDALEHDLDFDPEHGLPYSWPQAGLIGVEPAPAGELNAERGRRTARLLRLWSAFDALNICVFAAAPTRPLTIDYVNALVTAVSGHPVDLLRTGQTRLDLMRAYAQREGGGPDTLPDRLHDEPVAAGPHQGAVLSRAGFAEARTAFMHELGWS